MSLLINKVEHDFEVLLNYVADQKVILTPKQQLFPVRHIKTVMEHFEIKESHEDNIGDQIYKKREEREYSRFYFLDLLAICGGFLKITKQNQLEKGPNWKPYFSVTPGERGFMIFYEFRHSFSHVNWLLRGGDYAEQIEEKLEKIWPHVFKWRDGKTVDWVVWAKEAKRACGLKWNSIDQTYAEDLAIWGLEYCFVKPLEYFGFIEDKKEGDKFTKLQSFHLNRLGCENFSRLLSKSGRFLSAFPPFPLN